MNPFPIQKVRGAEVLRFLLADCDEWLGNGSLSELPNLTFHLSGADGATVALELKGEEYVIEATSKPEAHSNDTADSQTSTLSLFEAHMMRGHASNSSQAGQSNLRSGRRCMPAFGSMEYNTIRNGPVWIFGTPFFFAYTVTYDSNSSPPAVAFTSVQQKPCGSCSDGAGLISTRTETVSDLSTRATQPRRIEGQPRVSDFDLSLPL